MKYFEIVETKVSCRASTLREVRRKNKIRLKDVARLAGVSEHLLCDIEAKRRTVGGDRAMRIDKALAALVEERP